MKMSAGDVVPKADHFASVKLKSRLDAAVTAKTSEPTENPVRPRFETRSQQDPLKHQRAAGMKQMDSSETTKKWRVPGNSMRVTVYPQIGEAYN